MKRILAVATLLVAAFVLTVHFGPKTTHAQYGASLPIGWAAGATNFSTLATTTGAAGTVTNTSGFIMEVDGGPVYCFGGEATISESNLTLVANTSYIIVYNCQLNTVYAKTGVTAPGTPSPNQPGVPTTLLFAAPPSEVGLATVVCGAATCATITDVRAVVNFPFAKMLGQATFVNLPATYPNGAMVYCSTCTVATSPCTGASTGALAIRVNGAWRCQ